MKITFTFRHMESTEALKSYARNKLSKLHKFFQEPVAAEVTFSVERHVHTVDVQLSAGSTVYRGSEGSSDMYASLDAVADKLKGSVPRPRLSKGHACREA